jgi:hypothetical protein
LAVKIVYQTLEDRGGDLDSLERNGPYLCKWENAWLGEGYYFWDTFIENAHWWGIEGRKFPGGYIICKAECDYNEIDCLDLVGNTDHIQDFKKAVDLLKSQGLLNSKTSVKRVIEFMKQIKIFKYSAIRFNGGKSKNYKSDYSKTLLLEDRSHLVFELFPAIQICFVAKNSLGLRNYKIEFPEKYRED